MDTELRDLQLEFLVPYRVVVLLDRLCSSDTLLPNPDFDEDIERFACTKQALPLDN